jgi:hypothetical protein
MAGRKEIELGSLVREPQITDNKAKKHRRHRKVRLASGKEFGRVKSSTFTVRK